MGNRPRELIGLELWFRTSGGQLKARNVRVDAGLADMELNAQIAEVRPIAAAVMVNTAWRLCEYQFEGHDRMFIERRPPWPKPPEPPKPIGPPPGAPAMRRIA